MSVNKHIIDVKSKGAVKAKKEIQGVSNSLKSMAKSAAQAAGAYFGARALLGAVNASIDAFKEQELSEKKLEAALGKTSQALLNQASALQKVTMFGDEAIITAQALIGSFVRDEEAISLATEATLDLAAAKGMDLTAAADLVSKTLGSSTNALSRYGIEVTGAVGSTERLTSLTENIANVFGGQAAAQAETLEGATTQLTNAFGDLQETLVTDFAPALESSAKSATTFIERITTSLKISQLEAFKSTEAYKTLGDAALLQSKIAEKALLEQQLLLEENPNLFLEFAKIIQGGMNEIALASFPMLQMLRDSAELLGFVKINTDDLNAAWIGFQESLVDTEAVEKTKENLEELNATITELQEKQKEAADDNINNKEDTADASDKVVKAEFDIAKANRQVVADLQVAGKEFKAFQKVAKATAIAQTIYDTYQAAQGAYKTYITAPQAKLNPPLYQALGIAAAVAATAAGLAKVQQIKKAQYGADFVTDGPQMMMVGEGGGPERVQVTPLADPNIEGPQGQGITLNISGNVLHESFVEDNIIPQIREGLRLGENMGV
tara:strand:- start:13292 stop:14950 length:1659 start_codon:yes stop_codon:yes gene_type:complete